jgi:hypothetical protein
VPTAHYNAGIEQYFKDYSSIFGKKNLRYFPSFHLLKNGGGWRWLAEFALFSMGTSFSAVLFSTQIPTYQHIHPKYRG